jgi:hypothetical protein
MRFSNQILVATLVAATFGASCASDDDASPTTEIVVAGAPLTMSGPALVGAADGSLAVIGTLSNVTDRTIEVVGATSTVGEASFESDTGSMNSVVIEPGDTLELELAGTHLVLDEAPDGTDTATITLELDIQDEFTFDAALETGGET